MSHGGFDRPAFRRLPLGQHFFGDFSDDEKSTKSELIGQEVRGIRVFHGAGFNTGVHVELTLANGKQVYLGASSWSDPGHKIVHAFLTNEHGEVCTDLPFSPVSGVQDVEHEEARPYLCCGHIDNSPMTVRGMAVDFKDGTTRHFYAWEQCDPSSDCGDPHGPSYLCWRLSSNEPHNIGKLEERSLLPRGYLTVSVKFGPQLIFHNATGFSPHAETHQPLWAYQRFKAVACIAHCGETPPVALEVRQEATMGLGLLGGSSPVAALASSQDALVLPPPAVAKWRDGAPLDELLATAIQAGPHCACCWLFRGGAAEVVGLLRAPASGDVAPGAALKAQGGYAGGGPDRARQQTERASGADRLSLRVALGPRIGSLGGEAATLIQGRLKCRAVPHRGASLDHLVTSADMLHVVTLFGTAPDLLADLRSIVAVCPSAGPANLRVQEPTADEMDAFLRSREEVIMDTRNKALYALQWSMQAGGRWDSNAGFATIRACIDVLEAITAPVSTQSASKAKRLCFIH